MGRMVIYAVMAALLLFPALSSGAVEGFARISLVEGEVQIRDEEFGEWLPAGLNTPLGEGDSVWAPGGSRVEIQLRNGTYLRLEGRTVLDLVDMELDQQRVHVSSGRLYVKTGSRADDLQVDWGDASVLVERKTRLKVDLLANGDEEVSIIKGAASVESAGERTRVRAGETLTLHDYRRSDTSPLRPVDEWERWNARRDKQLAARKRGDTYLPEELVIYEDELASSGDWIVVEEYGYVWRPRLVVGVDWAPYRYGRWVWRGYDYVWITAEPWGWVPYHYGRWAVVPGRGWCWVPPARGDVFWGPGYVAWVSGGDHVGWVPLAPRETYYGRGHRGRHSVDISRDSHVSTSITINLRNVTVGNAVTRVRRDDFARGGGRYEPSRERITPGINVVVPRPSIRPAGREARMPLPAPVSSRQTPPAVARPPVKELRERYPLLRDIRQRKGEKGDPRVEKRDTPPPRPGDGRPEARTGGDRAVSQPLPPGRERDAVPGMATGQVGTKAKDAPPQEAPTAPAETRKPGAKVEGDQRGQGRTERQFSPPRRSWRVETREDSRPPALQPQGRQGRKPETDGDQGRPAGQRRRDDR